jgi:hypothetical protein
MPSWRGPLAFGRAVLSIKVLRFSRYAGKTKHNEIGTYLAAAGALIYRTHHRTKPTIRLPPQAK